MESLNVSAIIPAFNEERTIGETLQALKDLTEIHEILVIDDGSMDDTIDVVEKMGIVPVKQEKNMGKGAAMTRGAKQAKGEILVFLDADLGLSAKETVKLIKPILLDEADVAVAKFPEAKKKGGFGLVKGFARKSVKYLGGIDFHSSLSGQRAMKREVFYHLGAFDSGFGVEVGMTIDIARAGFRLTEVETEMTHRETGRDLQGFIHRGKQFLQIFLVVLRKLIGK